MHRRWIPVLLFALVGTIHTPSALAAPCGDAGEFPVPKRSKVVYAAPVIVIGVVTGWRTAEDVGIFTQYTFRVECVVRGQPPNPLVVRVLGGCVSAGGSAMRCMSVSDGNESRLEEGRRMRIFLKPVLDREGTFEQFAGADGVQMVPLVPSTTSPDAFAVRRYRLPEGDVTRTGPESAIALGSALALTGAAVALRRFRTN